MSFWIGPLFIQEKFPKLKHRFYVSSSPYAILFYAQIYLNCKKNEFIFYANSKSKPFDHSFS